MSERRDALFGWRLWRLRDAHLESWAASYTWVPGDNVAHCLAPLLRCSQTPGRGCRCGFWGLFSLINCLKRARAERTERSSVLGLIRAWGDVALHGQEGFRAQHASIACLFTDWAWDVPSLPVPERGLPGWWWRIQRALRYVSPPLPPDPWRKAMLGDAAATYGVPLLSLEDGLRVGFLEELGIESQMQEEARAWVSMIDTRAAWWKERNLFD